MAMAGPLELHHHRERPSDSPCVQVAAETFEGIHLTFNHSMWSSKTGKWETLDWVARAGGPACSLHVGLSWLGVSPACPVTQLLWRDLSVCQVPELAVSEDMRVRLRASSPRANVCDQTPHRRDVDITHRSKKEPRARDHVFPLAEGS